MIEIAKLQDGQLATGLMKKSKSMQIKRIHVLKDISTM